MKAQVIFYSALIATFLDLAASLPYAADLQRYSHPYQSRPSYLPQPQYQNVGQRHYDGYNNHYQLPQEQELPRIHQDHVFANEQHYLNNAPPQIQPEITNERYVNQQKLPNPYYAHNVPQQHYQDNNWRGPNHQVNENQHINVVYPEVSEGHNYPQPVIQHRYPENVRHDDRVPPSPVEHSYYLPSGGNLPYEEKIPVQIPPKKVHDNQLSPVEHLQKPHGLSEILAQLFSPPMPSFPAHSVHSNNDGVKPVDNNLLRAEPVQEHEIPVIPPPPTPSQIENGTPLSASERQFATAGNPVEQTPVPETQKKPNAEKVFSDPRIQNVLSNTKHIKRYLVIHPDGRIEHVDKLETVAKDHPNYILVNAGDIVPTTSKNGTVENNAVPSPSKPVEEKTQPTNGQSVPTNKTVEVSPINKTSTVKAEAIIKPPSAPEAVSTTTTAPLPSSTASSAPTSTPAIVVATFGPAANASIAAPTTNAPIAAPTTNVPIVAPTTNAPTTVPGKNAPTTVSASNVTTTTPAPSVPAPQAAASVVVSTAPVSSPQATLPASIPQTSTSAPSKNSTTVPTSTPKNIKPSDLEIKKEVLPSDVNNNTELVPNNPQKTVPNKTTEVTPTTPDLMSFTFAMLKALAPTNSPPKQTSDSTPKPTTESTPAQTSAGNKEQVTPTPAPIIVSTPQPNVEQSTPVKVLEIVDPEDSNNSTQAPLVVPVLYDPTEEVEEPSIDQYILDTASDNVTPNPGENVPDLGGSNIVAKVPHDPVVWFRTSDPNFWRKISDKHPGFDIVYFFQIHNKPKVLHDTKRTVFANGTVLEEITETSYDYEGADPKVKKTTTLKNPEQP
ncbi:proteoglycan 4-like [Ostrinia furnacalis]|uniref:proteoglycan 4-like n=1 Tax=Ostrinia furnacalis TaxID=93504 RepID=UPI00103DFFE0|nr:proteoglycan 4-like [Ostrinia furnacalis]